MDRSIDDRSDRTLTGLLDWLTDDAVYYMAWRNLLAQWFSKPVYYMHRVCRYICTWIHRSTIDPTEHWLDYWTSWLVMQCTIWHDAIYLLSDSASLSYMHGSCLGAYAHGSIDRRSIRQNIDWTTGLADWWCSVLYGMTQSTCSVIQPACVLYV